MVLKETSAREVIGGHLVITGQAVESRGLILDLSAAVGELYDSGKLNSL